MKESVDDEIAAANARWTFGGDVPDHFDQHIERSIPMYSAGHDIVVNLSDFFIHDGSLLYDIGCSTGALIRRLAKHLEDKSPRIVGLEIEPAMVSYAQSHSADQSSIEIHQANVTEWDFEPCSLVISYYTMQFIHPSVRQALFRRLYAALEWGGAIVLFEKVRGPDARFQDILTSLYTEYKLARGFSEAQIVNKTRSLKGVLEPFSTRGNTELLQRAGFEDIMTIHRHICFEGYLAIK